MRASECVCGTAGGGAGKGRASEQPAAAPTPPPPPHTHSQAADAGQTKGPRPGPSLPATRQRRELARRQTGAGKKEAGLPPSRPPRPPLSSSSPPPSPSCRLPAPQGGRACEASGAAPVSRREAALPLSPSSDGTGAASSAGRRGGAPCPVRIFLPAPAELLAQPEAPGGGLVATMPGAPSPRRLSPSGPRARARRGRSSGVCRLAVAG